MPVSPRAVEEGEGCGPDTAQQNADLAGPPAFTTESDESDVCCEEVGEESVCVSCLCAHV